MELQVRPHKLAALKVSELHVRPHKLAALKVSGGSTRSTGTIKLNIRPTSEATTCPNTKGPSPRVSGGPTRSTGTIKLSIRPTSEATRCPKQRKNIIVRILLTKKSKWKNI